MQLARPANGRGESLPWNNDDTSSLSATPGAVVVHFIESDLSGPMFAEILECRAELNWSASFIPHE